MCGEHRPSDDGDAGRGGSSPHVRGTLGLTLDGADVHGIIPACAGNTWSRALRNTWKRDHPRMCGEHQAWKLNGEAIKGSSPHVRGTRVLVRGLVPPRGIIPACAGNTPRMSFFLLLFGDHPRMCGEHPDFTARISACWGSSPHVRGTLCKRFIRVFPIGIIPACAGNTALREPNVYVQWDHPRMCGEHDREIEGHVARPGSSPHVRGTLPGSARLLLPAGIIPACAGNTRSSRRRSATARDHPRMCGEHFTIGAMRLAFAGSSPHVRGTLYSVVGFPSLSGIIPACAGNTSWTWATRQWSRDHPRMCGEHQGYAVRPISHSGSSPHVRGTPHVPFGVEVHAGIIPACAGNTGCGCACSARSRDHPRMCGEHSRAAEAGETMPGSSPHVRGTPAAEGHGSGQPGIIPACAGNTWSRPSSRRTAGDHPRMCGEHTGDQYDCKPGKGSSPHVRGTLIGRGRGAAAAGIIPACAGNTRNYRSRSCSRRDHPRMCGEHDHRRLLSWSISGSSPHVRGTPGSPNRRTSRARIIPACAGNTWRAH